MVVVANITHSGTKIQIVETTAGKINFMFAKSGRQTVTYDTKSTLDKLGGEEGAKMAATSMCETNSIPGWEQKDLLS